VVTNAEVECRVIGGASFPAPLGTVTVSWPLAAAVVSSEGIEIIMRRSVFRWMFVGVMSDSPGPKGVSRFIWSDLAKVDVAPKSIVLRARSGYSCKFGVLRASSLEPLVDVLRVHGVPIEHVASTWRWYFNPSWTAH
jgi:hypothetical protein